MQHRIGWWELVAQWEQLSPDRKTIRRCHNETQGKDKYPGAERVRAKGLALFANG